MPIEIMRTIPTKVGLAFGILAIAVFLVMYSIAMSLDNEYAFFENYLSDLGVGSGAWAFNSGVIITGVLLVLFAVFGFGPILGSDRLSNAGKALMALSGLLLAGVGIFNEDYEPYHYIFSVSYFLTFLVALVVIAMSLYRTRRLGRSGVVISAVASVFGALLLPMGGNPESETLAVIAMVVWGLSMSCLSILREYGRNVP